MHAKRARSSFFEKFERRARFNGLSPSQKTNFISFFYQSPVAAIHDVISRIFIPAAVLFQRVPLFRRPFVANFRQIGAIEKGKAFNAGNAYGDIDRRDFAPLKRTRFYPFHAGRNDAVFTAYAEGLRGFLNQTIFAAVINGVALFHGNGFQPRNPVSADYKRLNTCGNIKISNKAPAERTVLYPRHAAVGRNFAVGAKAQQCLCLRFDETISRLVKYDTSHISWDILAFDLLE